MTLIAALLLAISPQEVSNRAPESNEIGYKPADGSTVRLNPPSMIWLHEPTAVRYEAQWSTGDFEGAATAKDLPFNTYTHFQTLDPGTYRWRYRFVDAGGRTSTWSKVRTFTIPANAVPFPMPTRAEQRKRIPKNHPRLFLRPEDLPRLREAAKGAHADRFRALREEADRLIAAGPTPEPAVRATHRDPKTRHLWWPNRQQAERACMEAETIAFVSLLTGEEKYKKAARKWVMHLASFDPDGPTQFALNCEAAKPMLFRPARAYDWAYDALTPDDREKVRAVMRRRALDFWNGREVLKGVGHLNSPYNNHAQRVFHKLGESAIVFLGEIPEAETWLDYSLNKFYAAYPVWSDDDGGWHQGVSYWGGYMRKVVWWLQVMRSALDIDGFRKPYFAQIGDFPLYLAPPGAPNSGMADLSHRPPSPSWGAFIEYILRAEGERKEGARSGYWRWWTQQWNMEGQDGVLGFLYAANLPPLPEPTPPDDLPVSKIFHGVGIASLHTTLKDSAEDVHVVFKASPFGNQSHGLNPQNSFIVNAYGEELLTQCVYRDLYGSPFHSRWCFSTRAHCAVLVDGKDQIRRTSAPTGRIVDERLTPGWDYVVGDAAAAYEGRLERYRRHVLHAKPDIVVVYDDLVARNPATFEFMLHGLKAFDVDAEAAKLSLDRPKAGVVVRYLTPLPLSFRQWDGYDPEPFKKVPNQWHVEAGTKEKRKALGMLTVIVPHRAGRKTAWTAERIESATAIGARIERDGKTVRIAFRKHGVDGAASVDDLSFEGPAAVSR